MNTPTYTAQQLAEQFGLQVHGDGSTAIHGVATLAHAGPGQLTFLANPRYRAQLADSRAGIVVLRAEDAEAAPGSALIAKDPYTTFAKIGALFDIAPARPPGIHPSAVIDPSAQCRRQCPHRPVRQHRRRQRRGRELHHRHRQHHR
ncbi:LpxD N-terminal domain-containing protein [Stenotrophomonas rhizophila]